MAGAERRKPSERLRGYTFYIYAERYLESANQVGVSSERNFPIPYALHGQALELFLKSYLWLMIRPTEKEFRKYGHDLALLWHKSKETGVARYARATPLRDHVIATVSELYKNKQFHYLDLATIRRKQDSIKFNGPIPTLERLNTQLCKSLQFDILNDTN